jgi:hypothetical protein
MSLEQEPTLEILNKRIDELEMIVRQLKATIDKMEKSTKQLPLVPHIPTPGSIGESALTIGKRQVNFHENEQRLAWERATGAQ